jgi:glycosyltransferase involved in cell wall biosynthesis
VINVLVVGQTPPPFHGQALGIESIVKGNYESIRIFHVRMAFSNEISDIGKFQWRKLFHLISVIGKIIYTRLKHNIEVLYYPVAGPNKNPMYRDMVILTSTRWLFKKTIFHFRAAGISEIYQDLSPLLKLFFHIAYFGPDGTITMSEFSAPDCRVVKSKRDYIVHNGVDDHYSAYRSNSPDQDSIPKILFVGSLRESKGVLVLLEACKILHHINMDFELNIMGQFKTEQFKAEVFSRIDTYELQSKVRFLGVLTADEKWEAYAEADIFCFPTFFESESMPRVIIEAMQFALPVVSTMWRGVPSLVQDGQTGYLVPIKDSSSVAERLERLIRNPHLAKQMGQKGRERYLGNFTLDCHLKNIENAILSVQIPETLS